MTTKEFAFGPTYIKIHLEDREGKSSLALNFRLYDHPAAKRWMNLMLKTKALDSKFLNEGSFFGNALNDRGELIRGLDATVDYHDRFCRERGHLGCLIGVKADDPLTQDRLSELHGHFERWAEDPRFKDEPGPKYNLQTMNILIHKLESCLNPDREASHVELLSERFMKLPLTDEDYRCFRPDHRWGELLLTYGITGVPTFNAFNVDADPTPQDSMTNGMVISFWGDVPFTRQAQLEEWYRKKGMDPEDPKNAFGYVPLGMLVNVEQVNRADLLNKIAAHPRAVGYSFHEARASWEAADRKAQGARWPFDPEIFYHLDLVPYLDLQVKFDARKLYEEAYRARDYFVTHRDYDQSSLKDPGKWKALGLRALFGDYTKTQYHTSYSFEGKPEYRDTPFAELCPETMKFLGRLTDLSACERVRFMLLEPGATIHVHRDSHDRDVSLAVNISLNMPEGCVFHAQLDPDGAENPHSVRVPFQDGGSVILFNNAKYHKVVNDSPVPRIHIIFHGPIRFSDEELIRLARAQNRVGSHRELLQRLIQKKGRLGEELTKSPTLFQDWIATGLSPESLPAKIGLAVFDHAAYADGRDRAHHLEKRTGASLFPLPYQAIREEEWDGYLAEARAQGKEFAVIMAAGLFVLDTNRFLKEVIATCQELKASGTPAAGHLMDFRDRGQLPYFHEQFLIVNLQAWEGLGGPPLGPLFHTLEGKLVDAKVSERQVHDDYTPLTIEPSSVKEGRVTRKGVLGWGSGLIIRAVEAGARVVNISHALRGTKAYAYPRDPAPPAGATLIEEVVKQKLEHARGEVFCFNNEDLKVVDLPSLRPNVLITVAAGFKPFQIMKQYGLDEGGRLHFMDFSRNALEHAAAVCRQDSLKGVLDLLRGRLASGKEKYGSDSVEFLLDSVVRDHFNGDEALLLRQLRLARDASFEEVNLVLRPGTLAERLGPGDRFVVWISNAFYNNHLYLLLTRPEADAVLLKSMVLIGRKTQLRVFQFRDRHTYVFGKGLDFIRGIVTDGALTAFDPGSGDWHEVGA